MITITYPVWFTWFLSVTCIFAIINLILGMIVSFLKARLIKKWGKE